MDVPFLRISTSLVCITLLMTLFSLVAAQTSTPAGWFAGDGTQYTLSNPSNGNCNFMSFPEEAKTKYAALNKAQFKSTTNCGRCAQVSCVDAKCAGAAQKSEIVHIVDQCPECVRGDLDLSPDVFKSITGHEGNRLKIQWKFVDCPVTGKIQYCLKEGSNTFWTAVQPTNFLVGIQSLQVNGQSTTMVDSAYYFLRDGKSASQADLSALKVTLTSVNGEVLEETISLAGGGCVDSKFQFSKDRAADSAADFSDQTPTHDGGPVTQSTPSPVVTTPAPTTANPTPTPEPTPEPTPTATPTPTPTPTASETSTPRLRGADESGEIQPTMDAPTPTPTPTVSPSGASVAVPTDQAGDVHQAVTRSDNDDHATSPVLLILLMLACTCVFVLGVLAVIVKYKRRLKRESQAKHDVEHVSELPRLIVKQTSYEELETPSRRADIAVL